MVSITTRIVLGDELEILEILAKSERCKTISTSFVESRNGAFRKDNKRHTRKTKCHSKRIEPHDAHVVFLKCVYNLTKENEKFKIMLNPDAKKFEIKYKRVSPAMKQGPVSYTHLDVYKRQSVDISPPSRMVSIIWRLAEAQTPMT